MQGKQPSLAWNGGREAGGFESVGQAADLGQRLKAIGGETVGWATVSDDISQPLIWDE